MTPDPVARINALTANARTTWFALLGVLVFVGVTLMGVEHIDFYGVNRETQLPLVNVSVPTRLFFIAAPILTAAVFCYFHLYLIRLIDVLSRAKPRRPDGTRLGDEVAPWLVIDALLLIRRLLRDDNCAVPRSGEKLSAGFNIATGWGLGLVVLWFCWSRSLPARSTLISLTAMTSLSIAALFATFSAVILFMRMWAPNNSLVSGARARFDSTALNIAALAYFLSLLAVGAVVTLGRTDEPHRYTGLAPIEMPGEQIVTRPNDWLPYDIAQKDFLAVWCRRDQPADCKNLTDDEQTAFDQEWTIRREAALAALQKPDLNPLRSDALPDDEDERESLRYKAPDLRGANLRGAFLNGLNLTMGLLQNADLFRAELEGADLWQAEMQGADLSRAQMQEAVLSGAEMQGADLSYSHLTGTPETPNLLQSTNLSASTNNGGALRFVHLTRVEFDRWTDFRNAFLDGSVEITPQFRARAGNPCQWTKEKLTRDAGFYGRWRWWLETGNAGFLWEDIAPEEWRDVPINPGPTDCTWQTGPTNGPK